MKSPPVQVPDSVARDNTEEFIAEYGGAPKLPGKAKIAHQGRAELLATRLAAACDGQPTAAVGRCRRSVPSDCLQDRPGHSLPLGAAPRGQPLRRAALRRALRARPPRGGDRAVGLARADPRGARADRPARATTPRRSSRAGLRRSCWRSARACPFRARRLGVAAGRRVADDRGPARHAELDFVHVHEPFAPSAASAALRHSHALNVGTLPRADRARALDPGGAARWSSCCSAASTGAPPASARPATWWRATSPATTGVIHPGADLVERPHARPTARSSTSSSRPRRSAARCGCSCARCGGCRRTLPLARDDLVARPRERARRLPAAAAPRPRALSPARRTARRRSTSRAPTSSWRPRAARRPRRSCCPARDGRRRGAGGVAAAALRGGARATASSGCCSSRATPTRWPGSSSGWSPSRSCCASSRGRIEQAHPELDWGRTADAFEELYAEIAARRHDTNGNPGLRKRLAERPLDRRRPAHAHRPLARLRDAGRHAARHGQGARASARSPSPTTTRSRARSRRASAPTGSR